MRHECSNYSSHLKGNICPSCQQPYVFSFVSFEILPLVEFHLESDITDAEAERLLLAPPRVNESHPDPFTDTMIHEDLTEAFPVALDRETLRAMDSRTVLIAKWPLGTRFYRNLLPELQITICPECFQAFHMEDFELQVLQKGHCPFCRATADALFNT